MTTCHDRARRSIPAAAVLAAAFAAPAAAQQGHSIDLSGPTTAAAGDTVTLRATGTVPADVFLQRYVNVYALARSVVMTCPGTYQGAIQIKDNSTAQGSDTVATFVPVEGQFSIPVAYAPSRAGSFVLCAYLHEGAETMARDQHDMTIASGGGGGARPAAVTKPKVRRSGRKLRCDKGTWSGAPTRFRYRWIVDGRRKAGATKRTLRVTTALRGTLVRCGVTATNAAGSRTVLSAPRRV